MSVAQHSASRLAIHGGPPVRTTLLPYGHQEISEEDIQAVVAVLHSDWITQGPKVEEFEEAFAADVGATYAVSFSSGTAALHGAVFAAGLGPGDEAVTTPLTFCATANCVLYQGAKPVFADICPGGFNLDPEQVAQRMTTHTKAIMPVDYAGHPSDLDAFIALATRHGLVVIEDACPALGATYKGRRVGGISHMTVFSFHPVKHLTTGEGGMVTTDNPQFAKRLRLFRNHGIETDARRRQTQGQWFYEMVALGYNYRLSDIGCALGLSQLKRLTHTLPRRREIAARYQTAFQHLAGVILPPMLPGVEPAWAGYPIRLDRESCRLYRDDVIRALWAERIAAAVHYIPVPLHPYYRQRFGYQAGDYPVAEEVSRQVVTLPLFPAMTDRDADDVIRALEKIMSLS